MGGKHLPQKSKVSVTIESRDPEHRIAQGLSGQKLSGVSLIIQGQSLGECVQPEGLPADYQMFASDLPRKIQ